MTNIASKSTSSITQSNNSTITATMSSTETAELVKQQSIEAVSAQIEDGELPEDGEIMEDEEEVPVPVVPTKSSSSSSRTRESSSAKSSKKIPGGSSASCSSQHRSSNKSSSSKYKDYDSVGKSTKQIANQDALLLNSWVSGVQKKSAKAISEVADSLDPNEEYYGVANTSEMVGGEEKPGNENDPTGVSSTTPMDDKDYRMALEEGSLADQDLGGGFGEDSDYRRMAHSPVRQDRRRRRSNSPDDYQNPRFMKRQRGDSPPQLTGRFRRNPIHPRWAEHTICKFFREGFCRDGDDCAYSHLASDSHRRTDLCKYYQHGYCKKGLACLHLHGEYPCKAFHKGECSKEQCQYSHQALDEFTQPIFDQMMRDEELASRVSLPSHPLRRKVLLPLGPETSMNESSTSNDQSFIPPPSVVVPVLSSMPPAVMVKTEQDKVMAQTGTYGFFNPITPVSNSVSSTTSMQQQPVLPPPHLSPFSSPPNNNNNSFVLPVPHTAVNLPTTVTFTSTLPTQSAPNLQSSPKMNLSNVKVEMKPEPEPVVEQDTGGFNINQMLEKITQQVNASSVVEEVEDSPASPPSFFNDTSMFQDTKMIPVRSWKLHMVDVNVVSPINIDFKQIQSSPSLKNDPRVKKQVESQFDQGTENLKLATSLLPPLPLSGASSAPKPAKPIDPRTKDPRKKAAVAKNTIGGDTTTPTPPAADSSTQQQAGPFEEFSLEKLVQKQIQMANKLAQDSQPHTTTEEADIDHRPAFGGASSAQSQHLSIPSNGSNTFAQPSLTTTGFGNTSKFPVQDPSFANLAAFEPPPFTNPNFQAPAGASPNQYGGQHTSYYSEPNDFSRGGGHRGFRGGQNSNIRGTSGYDRRIGNNRKHQNGAGNTSYHDGNLAQSPPGAHTVQEGGNNGGEAPLTLREKRKNNEYESPLARVSRY